MNSPETPIFTKGNLLFNLDRARTQVGDGRPFVLVEGQLDAIRCWSAGLKTAIAPQGTSITDGQLALLRRYHPQVECFFDSDSAGQKAALRFLPLALRAGLALGATAAVLVAESAGWLPDRAVRAIDWACGLYVLVRVGRARISPLYLLLWGPLAWFAPQATALALFLFGGRKHVALAEAKKEVNRVAWRLSDEPDFGGNRFHLLGDRHGQDTFGELRRQIKGAKRRISLSTYILSDDAVGREIVNLLTARAKEGIEVRLLVDAIGSFGIPLRLCRPLRRAGGKVARFNPALPMQGKGSANWRNHRKIAVFDGTSAIIGGQNLGLRYMGDRPSNRRFRDCSFLIEGPTAAAIERVFFADWCQATDEAPMSFATQLRERSPHVGPARVEVISSGPDCEGDPLWETYVKLFSNCKRSITVVTPYFIPDRTLFTLLVTAAHAGRHVKIMVPRRSDHRSVGGRRGVGAVRGCRTTARCAGRCTGPRPHLRLLTLGSF